MSSLGIAALIQYLPTLLALLIISICTIRGAIKGFRKSTILFVQYLVSIAIGFIVYFACRDLFYNADYSSLWSAFGEEFANAKTLYDGLVVLIGKISPQFEGLVNNEYMKEVINGLAGMFVSVGYGILTLIILPLTVRIFLYMIYLIFYREGKYKKRLEKQDKEYKPRRLLGLIPGVLRGFVCATISISLLNSCYFILGGGTSLEKGSEENITLLEQFNDDLGYDLNVIYQGFKKSRNSGIGKIYEAIKINGVPIDYAYFDLFTSSKINVDNSDDNSISPVLALLSENSNISIETILLREEIALIFKLVEDLLETNAIVIQGEDVLIDREALVSKVSEIVDNTIGQSKILSELVPLAIVGVVDSIQKNEFSINEDIDSLFKDVEIDTIKAIDIAGDISKIIKALVKVIDLVPYDQETKQFNFEDFTSMNTLLNLNPEVVKEIFNDLSEVKLLSDIVFPIGVGVVFTTYEEQINEQGIQTNDINLKEINWSFEIKNLGNLYSDIYAMELDGEKIMDQTINEETGLSIQMEYLLDLCSESNPQSIKFQNGLSTLIDDVFDSKLLSQTAFLVFKHMLTNFTITTEDGSPSDLADAVEMIKHNLNAVDEEGKSLYTITEFKKDVDYLVDSCLGLISAVPLLMDETIDQATLIENLDMATLKKCLIGSDYESTGVVTGGMYKMLLLSGDLNEDGVVDNNLLYATDELIKAFLKTFSYELVGELDLDTVTDWPREINAIIDCMDFVKQISGGVDMLFGGNIMESFTADITDEEINELTNIVSRSKIYGPFFEGKVKKAISNSSVLGSAINVEDENILWLDVLDETEKTTTYGEINKIFKIMKVLNKEDNKINLSDENSILNGFARMSTEDIDVITDSELFANSLTKIMVNLLFPDESIDFSNLDIEWANQYDENGQLISKGEFSVVCDILNIESLKDEEGNIDATRLGNLDTIAQLIKENSDLSLDYSEVERMAKSKFLMSIIGNKISNISSESVIIVVPEALNYSDTNADAYKLWAANSNDYKQGEFAKLVYALFNARKTVINLGYEKLDEDNLVPGLVQMTDYEPITDSAVLYATISNALIDLSDMEQIEIRSVAKHTALEAADNYNIVIKKEEISKALSILKLLGFTDFCGDIPLYKLLRVLTIKEDNSKDNVLNTINMMNESNIFNITMVSKIVASDGLRIPLKYKNTSLAIDIEDVDWYGDGELKRILFALAELLDQNETNIYVDLTNSIAVNQNKMIDSLALPSNTSNNSNDRKIDVVYSSDIFMNTISYHILEAVAVPYNDVNGNTVLDKTTIDYVIVKNEVKSLIMALNNLNIKFSNSLSNDHPIENITVKALKDNIDSEYSLLNSAILHRMITEELLISQIVPTKYFSTTPTGYSGSTNGDIVLFYGMSGEENIKAIQYLGSNQKAETNVNYIFKNHIEDVINGLSALYKDHPEIKLTESANFVSGDTSTIDVLHKLSNDQILIIQKSSILCYLISHTLQTNTYGNSGLSYVNYVNSNVGLNLPSVNVVVVKYNGSNTSFDSSDNYIDQAYSQDNVAKLLAALAQLH